MARDLNPTASTLERDSAKTQALRLIPVLNEIETRALKLEKTFHSKLRQIAQKDRPSAQNLLHYLAARQIDLRAIQMELLQLGLSSLGGMESRVMATLQAVLRALRLIAGVEFVSDEFSPPPVDFVTGPELLSHHSELLFGSRVGNRSASVMVTMPTEAASHAGLVRDLLAAGMDVMRINCAHDDLVAWKQMISHLRQAELELGRSCKIYADLAGPKPRTGLMTIPEPILKIRPQRNMRGEVIAPARLWLTPTKDPQRPLVEGNTILPLDQKLLRKAEVGMTLQLKDTRNKTREIRITGVVGISFLAETFKTIYFKTGTAVHLYKGKKLLAKGTIGPLPNVESPLRVKAGDLLMVVRRDQPGRNCVRDENDEILKPARVPCTMDEIFDSVKKGERIWFDDGKIGGEIVNRTASEIQVKITHTGVGGSNLRSGKGINLPDTELKVEALTPKDLKDLAFIAKEADIVGLSFVRSPEDVFLLDKHLKRLGGQHVARVFKIETPQAFQKLPLILLAGQSTMPFGVMVARGDLAIEIGFERLSEVQEEILWLCEAAHVPVIWATQILETLAKTGSPSRAEVSDAVMSSHAECAMLNKGPYMVETIRMLSGILERADQHRSKKNSMLRRLSIADISP